LQVAEGGEAGPAQQQLGFTLIELLVVLMLVAMGSAAVTLAWRDPAADRLQREAERLVMLLETARSEARSSSLALGWRPLSTEGKPGSAQPASVGVDFEFLDPQGQPLPAKAALSGAGFGASSWPRQWLTPGVQATVVGPAGANDALRLGPEAMIGAQRVILLLDGQRREIATAGLAPFEVRASDAPAP
jgi:general secretion pathway protein H